MPMHRLGRVEKDPLDTSVRQMKPLDWARDGDLTPKRSQRSMPIKSLPLNISRTLIFA